MSTTDTPRNRPGPTSPEGVRSTLEPAKQETVRERLQPLLVDLLDLSLTAKQLHWNVVGAGFKSLHEQLDEVTIQYRTWSDQVAERMTSVGIAPDGRVQRIAGDSPADPAPASWVRQQDVVTTMSDRIEAVARATRDRLDGLGDVDIASEDLLIGILDGLEMQLWMFSAQEA
ncbi:MAG: DNA starvation/stationary phase protection protein [Nitriliruptoraceae bacterium]